MKLLLLVPVIMILKIHEVSSNGTIEVRLVNFSNPKGIKFNEKCCDDSWFSFLMCPSCDHRFVICLGNNLQSSDTHSCEIGRGVIGDIKENYIKFESNVKGVDNPLKFGFNTWLETMKLNIDVEDFDDKKNFEFIDQYNYIFEAKDVRLDTPGKSVKLKGSRSNLNLELRIYCQPNYYGLRCKTFCSSTDNPAGHYTCDSMTGEKICLPGWSEDNCSVNTDDCVNHRCSNNSTCVDDIASYRCVCPPGKTGFACEKEVNECASDPCENGGTCRDEVNGYTCDCTSGYSGLQCQRICKNDEMEHVSCQFSHSDAKSNSCESLPCKNGGNCTETPSGFNCTCLPEFTNEKCDQNAVLHHEIKPFTSLKTDFISISPISPLMDAVQEISTLSYSSTTFHLKTSVSFLDDSFVSKSLTPVLSKMFITKSAVSEIERSELLIEQTMVSMDTSFLDEAVSKSYPSYLEDTSALSQRHPVIPEISETMVSMDTSFLDEAVSKSYPSYLEDTSALSQRHPVIPEISETMVSADTSFLDEAVSKNYPSYLEDTSALSQRHPVIPEISETMVSTDTSFLDEAVSKSYSSYLEDTSALSERHPVIPEISSGFLEKTLFASQSFALEDVISFVPVSGELITDRTSTEYSFSVKVESLVVHKETSMPRISVPFLNRTQFLAETSLLAAESFNFFPSSLTFALQSSEALLPMSISFSDNYIFISSSSAEPLFSTYLSSTPRTLIATDSEPQECLILKIIPRIKRPKKRKCFRNKCRSMERKKKRSYLKKKELVCWPLQYRTVPLPSMSELNITSIVLESYSDALNWVNETVSHLLPTEKLPSKTSKNLIKIFRWVNKSLHHLLIDNSSSLPWFSSSTSPESTPECLLIKIHLDQGIASTHNNTESGNTTKIIYRRQEICRPASESTSSTSKLDRAIGKTTPMTMEINETYSQTAADSQMTFRNITDVKFTISQETILDTNISIKEYSLPILSLITKPSAKYLKSTTEPTKPTLFYPYSENNTREIPMLTKYFLLTEQSLPTKTMSGINYSKPTMTTSPFRSLTEAVSITNTSESFRKMRIQTECIEIEIKLKKRRPEFRKSIKNSLKNKKSKIATLQERREMCWPVNESILLNITKSEDLTSLTEDIAIALRWVNETLSFFLPTEDHQMAESQEEIYIWVSKTLLKYYSIVNNHSYGLAPMKKDFKAECVGIKIKLHQEEDRRRNIQWYMLVDKRLLPIERTSRYKSTITKKELCQSETELSSTTSVPHSSMRHNASAVLPRLKITINGSTYINKTYIIPRNQIAVLSPPTIIVTVYRVGKRIYDIGSKVVSNVYQKTRMLLINTLSKLSAAWRVVNTMKNYLGKTLLIRKVWNLMWDRAATAYDLARQTVRNAYQKARTLSINFTKTAVNTSRHYYRKFYEIYRRQYDNFVSHLDAGIKTFKKKYEEYTNYLRNYWNSYIK